jgi:hypothetical protein
MATYKIIGPEQIEITFDIHLTDPIRLIDPEEAQRILDNQGANRVPKLRLVDTYAQDMLKGAWKIGAPLMYDTDGVLIDGQHRLLAVIKSGIPQVFTELSGFPPESKEVLDIGNPRTVANVAQISGRDMTARDAGVINAMYLPCPTSNLKTPQDKMAVFDAYKNGIKFINEIPNASKVGSVLKALLTKAYYYENHKRLQEFLEVFQTGHTGDSVEDSAAITLRNFTQDNRKEGQYFTADDRKLQYYLIAEDLLDKFIRRKESKQHVDRLTKAKKHAKKTGDVVTPFPDKYPLPHVQGNWNVNCKRYNYLVPITLNPLIHEKILELKSSR